MAGMDNPPGSAARRSCGRRVGDGPAAQGLSSHYAALVKNVCASSTQKESQQLDQGSKLRHAAIAGLDVSQFKQVLKAACATVKDDQQQLLKMVNSQDEHGATPLHCAAYSHRPSIIKELMRAGADPNIKDEDGHTPLHLVLVHADVDRAAVKDCLNELLTVQVPGGRKALVDTYDKVGLTPVMHAVHADLADAAVLLVEHGADLTAKSKVKEGSSAVPDQIRGLTALQMAVLEDRKGTLDALLYAFMDKDIHQQQQQVKGKRSKKAMPICLPEEDVLKAVQHMAPTWLARNNANDLAMRQYYSKTLSSLTKGNGADALPPQKTAAAAEEGEDVAAAADTNGNSKDQQQPVKAREARQLKRSRNAAAGDQPQKGASKNQQQEQQQGEDAHRAKRHCPTPEQLDKQQEEQQLLQQEERELSPLSPGGLRTTAALAAAAAAAKSAGAAAGVNPAITPGPTNDTAAVTPGPRESQKTPAGVTPGPAVSQKTPSVTPGVGSLLFSPRMTGLTPMSGIRGPSPATGSQKGAAAATAAGSNYNRQSARLAAAMGMGGVSCLELKPLPAAAAAGGDGNAAAATVAAAGGSSSGGGSGFKLSRQAARLLSARPTAAAAAANSGGSRTKPQQQEQHDKSELLQPVVPVAEAEDVDMPATQHVLLPEESGAAAVLAVDQGKQQVATAPVAAVADVEDASQQQQQQQEVDKEHAGIAAEDEMEAAAAPAAGGVADDDITAAMDVDDSTPGQDPVAILSSSHRAEHVDGPLAAAAAVAGSAGSMGQEGDMQLKQQQQEDMQPEEAAGGAGRPTPAAADEEAPDGCVASQQQQAEQQQQEEHDESEVVDTENQVASQQQQQISQQGPVSMEGVEMPKLQDIMNKPVPAAAAASQQAKALQVVSATAKASGEQSGAEQENLKQSRQQLQLLSQQEDSRPQQQHQMSVGKQLPAATELQFAVLQHKAIKLLLTKLEGQQQQGVDADGKLLNLCLRMMKCLSRALPACTPAAAAAAAGDSQQQQQLDWDLVQSQLSTVAAVLDRQAGSSDSSSSSSGGSSADKLLPLGEVATLIAQQLLLPTMQQQQERGAGASVGVIAVQVLGRVVWLLQQQQQQQNGCDPQMVLQLTATLADLAVASANADVVKAATAIALEVLLGPCSEVAAATAAISGSSRSDQGQFLGSWLGLLSKVGQLLRLHDPAAAAAAGVGGTAPVGELVSINRLGNIVEVLDVCKRTVAGSVTAKQDAAAAAGDSSNINVYMAAVEMVDMALLQLTKLVLRQQEHIASSSSGSMAPDVSDISGLVSVVGRVLDVCGGCSTAELQDLQLEVIESLNDIRDGMLA